MPSQFTLEAGLSTSSLWPIYISGREHKFDSLNGADKLSVRGK